MKVYLINLDKDRIRLEEAQKQLTRLNVPFVRERAVYARELPESELKKSVNAFRWWCAMGRPVMSGEIGCAMSHYGIYRRINESVCILEDDVILHDLFPQALDYVEKHIDLSRPQVYLFSNHASRCPEQKEDGQFCIRPARRDMYTEGYVITPRAAQALLKANWPLQTPCDHWGRWVRRGLIELYHVFPTVCRQDQSQYASGTIDPNCFYASRLSPLRFALHKFKRLIGKTFDIILPI